MAQLVKCLTLDVGLGHGLRVVGLDPTLGSVLGVDPAWFSLSPSPSAPTLLMHSLSLEINEENKEKKILLGPLYTLLRLTLSLLP